MVIIFLVVEGKKQEPGFIVNVNQSLKNHFPKYSEFRFVLHKKELYSTMTLVKEFINESQETLFFHAISDEQVIKTYNKHKKQLANALVEIQNQKFELNKWKNQTNMENQNKLKLMQENKQQQQQLEEHQNYLLKNSLIDPLLSQKQFESSIHNSNNSNTFSVPSVLSDLQKSQSIQSYNQPSNEEDYEDFSMQLLQAGNLVSFMQQEIQETEPTCMQDLELNKMVKSELQTVEFKCFYCNLGLTGNFIQTNCFHTYHEECLMKLINTQVLNNPSISQFTCVCSHQIKPQLLQIFQDQKQSRKLRNQIFNNQLEVIKSKQQHKYIKCSQALCEYFGIDTANTQTQNFKCPKCLEIIQNNK